MKDKIIIVLMSIVLIFTFYGVTYTKWIDNVIAG
jgi:hypothetical protein